MSNLKKIKVEQNLKTKSVSDNKYECLPSHDMHMSNSGFCFALELF